MAAEKRVIRKRRAKDPHDDESKPSFTKPGSKTMRVGKGKGLPKAPDTHPHKARNAKRSRKAR